MHGSQRCYGELVELTVDDIWQITDAGNQELWRLAHSSRRGTLELGAENDNASLFEGEYFPELNSHYLQVPSL